MKLHKFVIYGVLVAMSWLPSLSYGNSSVDPSQMICTIVFEDGSTKQGNGKNDLCLLYKDDPEVTVIPHGRFDWHTEHYVCKTDQDEVFVVTKKIFRANSYSTEVFGSKFTGSDASPLGGLTNQLMLTTQSSVDFEPWALVFHSDEMGSPHALSVHLQASRAPLYYEISCNQL
ncbi:MAG: hypothetical protein HRT45_10540 [Bdellovibrionales bacterium]|nr:hypothetical protein [Bdellovibrionales bacterium]